MKALINSHIFDLQSFKPCSYILFDSEIRQVGPMSEFPGADCVYDMKGAIVMPGLLVGHTHIYSTFARGMGVPFNPKSFRDILTQLWWKLDAALDAQAVYYSGLVSGIEFIKNGVTTIIDHHASGLAIKGTLEALKKSVCDELGMRGIFCFETSDRFDVDECIDENLEFAKARTEKHAGLFGMHASMSLSDETLEKIAKKIGDMPIHIHVAESAEDEQDSIKNHGKSVVKRLLDFKLINRNSILAHCVHIDEEEAEIIQKSGAYIALNPASNMNNGVGLPDWQLFKSKSIKCIIGNDGLGYNLARELQDLVFTMKHRGKSPTAFSLEDLKTIIDNGYEYAGKQLGIKLGRIKEGYKADMLSLPYASPTNINQDNAFSHIFFGAFDSFRPRDVICDGEFLLKDYDSKADTESIYEEARKVSQRVWERLNDKEGI